MFSNWKLRRYYGLIKAILRIFTNFKKGEEEGVLDAVIAADKLITADGGTKFTKAYSYVKTRYPQITKTCAMIAIHLMLAYARKKGLCSSD